MKKALLVHFCQRALGFKGKQQGYKKIADDHGIPRETFRQRLSEPLMGKFGHLSGDEEVVVLPSGRVQSYVEPHLNHN